MTDQKWTAPDSVWVDLRLNPPFVYYDSPEILTNEDDTEYLLATPKRKAAEELYEALEACRSGLRAILSQYEEDPSYYEIELADKALAKARGETE